jgi:hypothetical protein
MKKNKLVLVLSLLVSFNSFAGEDYKLTPQEIETLKMAAALSPLEPWNPKKEWPSIVNDDGTFDYGDKVAKIPMPKKIEVKKVTTDLKQSVISPIKVVAYVDQTVKPLKKVIDNVRAK